MSTQQKRLRASIQRIAREDAQLSKVLDAYANRGGFGAAVGSAQSDAEESRICCDGSTSDNANPGTATRDPDSGGQDGLDPDDPAKLTNGEGSLTGLTDCATGEPVCIDGGGLIPPEGWDAPGDPPIQDTYFEGYYWRRSSDTSINYATAENAGRAHAEDINGNYCGLSATNGEDPPTYTVIVGQSGGPCSGPTTGSGAIDPSPCGASSASYCNPSDDEISATAWPSDGCVNLAIINGQIVGSKYDPENDGSYSAPRDSIDLCDGSGNQISLAPSASGGWKTIDAINGGDGYLYDSSGTQIARISEAEYSDPNV